MLRTGVPWRDSPKTYGNWHTIYTRYKRWCESGFFGHLLQELQSRKEIKLDIIFVDGSIIPLHRHECGVVQKNKGEQSVGRGRKGLGTTLHLAVSKNGVVNYQLFPSQRQDCKTVEDLWQDWRWQQIKYGVADKGYDIVN